MKLLLTSGGLSTPTLQTTFKKLNNDQSPLLVSGQDSHVILDETWELIQNA